MAMSEQGKRVAGAPGALAVSMEDVRFAYPGGHAVLRGASLAVPFGTCVCLMGVNGCGKSTLLDCLLAEHHEMEGSVAVAGSEVRDLSRAELARRVAYVPQVHDRSFPYTVAHVVLMGCAARMRGLAVPDEADEARALEALAALGMAALAERPYTSLSGGEMQMVLLARALVQDAPIIVMDEPTAHLDFRNELLFLDTVRTLVRDQDKTVLVATHSPNQAFHMSQGGVPVMVAVMHEGRVVCCGTPEEVLVPERLSAVFGVSSVLLEGAAPDGAPVRQLALLQVTEPKGEEAR